MRLKKFLVKEKKMEVYERWLNKITKKEYEIIEKCEYQQRVRKADIGKS